MRNALFAMTAGLLLLAAPVLAQQQNLTGSIEGIVLRAETNEPIHGAQVVLAGPIPAATTAADGRFAFKEVAPGTYRPAVSLDGYVRKTGQALVVTPGTAVKDIVLHLTPTGSVNGRVVGPKEEPLRGMEAQLLQFFYDSRGRKTFRPVGTAQTNDRGEYRLYWITPGSYYLAAGPSSFGAIAPGTPAESGKIYVTTYYPGMSDPAGAVKIEVLPGVDLNAIDVPLRAVQTYRVRGRVAGGGTGGRVAIMPRDPIIPAGPNSTTSPYRADGEFEFRDVAPGQYWLVDSESPSMKAAVDVVDRDVDTAVVAPAVNASLSGRITVDARPLQPVPSGTRIFLGAPGPIQPDSDGTFMQQNVAPGEYQLTVSGLPGNFYVKEARAGSADALRQRFSIEPAEMVSLSIVLSPNAAEIRGSVTDNRQQPAAGARVVLIPDRGRGQPELYKSAAADGTGRFTIGGVAAGDYKLFAWTNLEPFAYFDPDLLDRVESRGKPVHVLDSANQTVDLTVILTEAQ